MHANSMYMSYNKRLHISSMYHLYFGLWEHLLPLIKKKNIICTSFYHSNECSVFKRVSTMDIKDKLIFY